MLVSQNNLIPIFWNPPLKYVIFYFQDAKKGVLFIDFPPVLQLQLKRFEYDFMRDTMVKVCMGFFYIGGSHFRVLVFPCKCIWYCSPSFSYLMVLSSYLYVFSFFLGGWLLWLYILHLILCFKPM